MCRVDNKGYLVSKVPRVGRPASLNTNIDTNTNTNTKISKS